MAIDRHFRWLLTAWAKYNKTPRDFAVLHANAKRSHEREPYRLLVGMYDHGWHVIRLQFA